MDEGYEKIMEIMEMNRFRQRLGLLDYTACWEEPDRVKGLDIEATKNAMESGYSVQARITAIEGIS